MELPKSFMTNPTKCSYSSWLPRGCHLVQFSSKPMITQNISLNTLLLFMFSIFCQGDLCVKAHLQILGNLQGSLDFTSCLYKASRSARGERLRSYTFPGFSWTYTQSCACERSFRSPRLCWSFAKFLLVLQFSRNSFYIFVCDLAFPNSYHSLRHLQCCWKITIESNQIATQTWKWRVSSKATSLDKIWTVL